MSRFVFFFYIVIILLENFIVSADHYDEKAVDGMILKMLWEKVYAKYDPKTKEKVIKSIRKGNDYDNLVRQLTRVDKSKAKKIINLVAEVMLVYIG
ncbi:unnamed protein product [Colias eurytheme]|nr:unnamed protein product [Colias eurytheme]